MFRWPLSLTPLSLGSNGTTRDTVLEITPRGAVFTLATLAHVGHPAHLAVVDAYLKGQMRLSGTAGIGDDSRLVASALAAPLVAAHEFGIEQLDLSDLLLLPLSSQERGSGGEVYLLGEGELLRVTESPRFLLREPGSSERWRWVRAAEWFEMAGCTGTPHPGLGSDWHDLIVQLPARPSTLAAISQANAQLALLPIEAELREPTRTTLPSAALVMALRALAQARFARAPRALQVAADTAIREIALSDDAAPLSLADLQQERSAVSASGTATLPPVSDPDALSTALAGPLARRQPVETALQFQQRPLGVSLTPDLDGYQTLCLLPPADTEPSTMFNLMRDAAWDVIEALIGRPLAERRTEPIALRLAGEDGRTTTLNVGASVVVVRNQVVFTAWVGSDGRVMLKLFPPGGMQIP